MANELTTQEVVGIADAANANTVDISKLAISVNTMIGTISANFEEIEGKLAQKMSEYEFIQYSSDSAKHKKEMKQDRADLNKLAKEIKDSCKTAKKEYLKPFDIFEARMKGLVDIVMDPCKLIDSKIKELEEAERDERNNNITNFFEQAAVGIIPEDFKEEFFDKIFDVSWLNISVSMKTYKDAITKEIENYKNGIQTIQFMDTEFEAQGMEVFRQTLCLNDAVAKINALKAEKAERERQLEEEKRRMEEENLRKLEEERLRLQVLAAQTLATEKEKIREEATRIAKEEFEREAAAKTEALKEKETLVSPSVITPVTTETPSCVSVETNSTAENNVTVTFSAENWAIVSRYLDRMGISYSRK